MVALVKVREDHLGVVDDEDANAKPDHRRDGRDVGEDHLQGLSHQLFQGPGSKAPPKDQKRKATLT